jgi:hypothetical protein
MPVEGLKRTAAVHLPADKAATAALTMKLKDAKGFWLQTQLNA